MPMHIEVRELWSQDRVAKGKPSVAKVIGGENVADGLTKRVDMQKTEQSEEACSMARQNGRHELCPPLGDGP